MNERPEVSAGSEQEKPKPSVPLGEDDFAYYEHDKPQIDINELKKHVQSFKISEESKKEAKETFTLNEKTLGGRIKGLDGKAESHDEKKALTLGERLVSNSIITRDQLEIALKEQRESPIKKELGTILVELSFITDDVLSQVLSEASGVKSVDLRSMSLDQDLVRKIPKNIAAQFKIIAIALHEDELMVATSDVYNVLAVDQVKRYFQKNIKITPLFANDFQITEIIDQYYDYEMNMFAILKELETGEVQYTGTEEGYVNPTVRLVDSIFIDAVKMGSSDIHFEPENEFIRLRYRIDGRLVQILSFHKDYWSSIAVRIKILGNLNIAESRNPQDGRITFTIMGRKVDFRISTLPTIHGENVVARILDKSRSLVSLNDLGLSENNIKILKRLLKRPEGVIIVTGPTGSGKTTTLYAILSYINSMEINIMTLEDPVEYQLSLIRQSQIREGSDLTFDKGIRSLMRQDPDVIFVGEVRDYDTAAMTIRAAMTGHQVFTTIHTNDALGAVPRFIDIGIKGSLLAGTMICSIAQRLARKLCLHCREEYTANDEECKILGVDPTNPPTLFKHRGCIKCMNTGYKGRIALYEILAVDRELDDMISREASRKEMMTYARSQGFTSMAEDAILKILNGITDIEEVVHTVDMTERLKDVTLFL